MKRTWQPKRKKRLSTHGFLSRMSSGGNIINKRRSKGRKRLAVTVGAK